MPHDIRDKFRDQELCDRSDAVNFERGKFLAQESARCAW
jgi:hypothetical protein